MTIQALRTHVLACPEPNDFGNTRYTLLLEMRTLEGIRAWGEAITLWPEAAHAVASLINSGLGDTVCGMDEREPEAVWLKLKTHTWWYGEGGLASMAISAIDMACWDAAAQNADLPLYALLGGRTHQSLPALASMHVNRATHEEGAEEVAGHIRSGFKGAKLGFAKRGLSRVGPDPVVNLAYLKAVRDACGPDASLMVDIGNGVRWDAATAIRATDLFAEVGIDWIEEPLHPDDLEGLAQLRRHTATRIATGEREWTVEGYRRLIATGLVDVVGVDPARAEGVTGFRKIAAIAEAARVTVNAHAWSSAILTAASLHLSLSTRCARWFELKPLPSPLQHELVRDPIWHVKGEVFAGNRPGLGIEIVDAALNRYKHQ